MTIELGRALKAARKEKRLPAKAVADHVGVSPAAVYQWESGSTEPTAANLVDAAALLGIDASAALRGEVVASDSPQPAPRAERREPTPELILPPVGEEQPAPRPGNRDVEIRGISIGSEDEETGDFSFNGEIVDYAARPSGLLRRRNVFMVRVANESMKPRHDPGDPLFVDSHQDPMPGEDVIVELKGQDGAPGPAYIKQLVRRSASKVVVRQFNPEKELEFERSRIKKLWRVIPPKELV